MICWLLEALWSCCFRHKHDSDKKHDELKSILSNIKNSLKHAKPSNACC